MKKHILMTMTTLTLALGIAFASIGFAADSQEKANDQYESSTSHNPLTSTTTTTVKKKSKYNKKNADGQKVNAEDQVELQKKKADDGSKVKTTTESTHTEEAK